MRRDRGVDLDKEGVGMELPGKDFRIGLVEAAGFQLDYAEAGPQHPSATIVSLPGSAGLEMSKAKDKLAAGYRVIELNPPGWGGKDDLNRDMTQSELGAILAEAIVKLVPGRLYLIGASMGGANALHVTTRIPDRIAGVILEGSMAPARAEDLEFPPIERAKVKEVVRLTQEGQPPNYPAPPPHPEKPWSTPEYIARQMRVRMQMMQWVETDFSAEAGIAVVRDRRIPVLALLGDRDGILKLSQKDTIGQHLPDALFRIIPGGEHDLQNTVAEAFVREVQDFIRSNPA